jgi:D-3-phosphoglycerate dehydrogenase
MAFKVVRTTPPRNNPLEDELFRDKGIDYLKKNCPTEEDLIETLQDADAVISVFEPFTRRVMETLSKMRVISQIGIGLDPVDLDAATDHGIIVTHEPDYCQEEVSDHAMSLILAFARKLPQVDRAVRKGKWGPEIREKIMPPMSRLRGQTLGLVGFGRIPRTLVRKAQGFGLRVITYDPYIPKGVLDGHLVEYIESLDDLLERSDFVSVHCALTKENRHMFGLEQFRKMKRTAFFINTARGGLVDEKALHTALTQGYIQGAALDVMEKEPPDPDNPLIPLDNVLITAHVAQYSEAAFAELMERPSKEVLRVFEGKWPTVVANPAVMEKYVAKWGPMK